MFKCNIKVFLLGSLLFTGTPASAFDPVTIGAMVGVLLIAAMLATYLPARRAAKVDPMEASNKSTNRYWGSKSPMNSRSLYNQQG